MILSILYCHFCDLFIDTDYFAEHFDEDLEHCEKEKEFNNKN